ncbi:MAG TPA: AMP-dependent synthetase [Crocinitomix sp.]|nr:AMP-dependent synthetase [Crocinitomix sp.]
MRKDIIFLENVESSIQKKVLKFVKQWNNNDEWIEVSTSGSTGKPKKIKLKKTNIKASAKATIKHFNLQANQNILLAMSTDFIAGKMMVVRAIEGQLNLIVASVQSNPLLTKLPCKIDFSAFVPMQVSAILSNPLSKQNYESITKVIIGGAPIAYQLEQELQGLKNKTYATFGMTETISHIATRNLKNKDKYYNALPNVKFSQTKRQQLVIDAPYLLNQPLVTNDVVQLINAQQFIWKGRLDNVINSGGVKLYPENIEKKIEKFFPNNRFYVTSKSDKILGQKLILKIETNQIFYTQKIKLSLKQVLSPYEIPKEIILVKQFKETKTGKVIRE